MIPLGCCWGEGLLRPLREKLVAPFFWFRYFFLSSSFFFISSSFVPLPLVSSFHSSSPYFSSLLLSLLSR